MIFQGVEITLKVKALTLQQNILANVESNLSKCKSIYLDNIVQHSYLSMLVSDIIFCIFFTNERNEIKTFMLERKSFYVSQAIQITFHGIVSYSVLDLHVSLDPRNNC